MIEFNEESPKELVEGKIEKIGEDKALITHKNLTNNKEIKDEESTELKDHHAGMFHNHKTEVLMFRKGKT